MTTREAAEYCGLSVSGFRAWRQRGIAPAPVKGTYRYDIDALNRAIDRASGLTKPQEKPIISPYDKWKAGSHETGIRARPQSH